MKTALLSAKNVIHLLALATAFLFLACTGEETPTIPPGYVSDQEFFLETGSLPEPSIHADNPLTNAGVQLGRMLFYEPMLSGDNSITCASCHKQAFAFSDNARYSKGLGGQLGKRNSMSIVNLAWHDGDLFWDGRAHLLREQALFPIQDKAEMNASLEDVIAKLSASPRYKDQFERAFGDPVINESRIGLALEQFMLTIVSSGSKYDLYLDGKAALSDAEERGRILFFAEWNPFFPDLPAPNCSHCHQGRDFSNSKFINNGLDHEYQSVDHGRQVYTGQLDDLDRFRVPTLRNIAVTGPYMHDGRFASLDEVIDHYDHGIHPSATLDPALEKQIAHGLRLSQQDKTDLIAFLHTLTDHYLLSNPEYATPF